MVIWNFDSKRLMHGFAEGDCDLVGVSELSATDDSFSVFEGREPLHSNFLRVMSRAEGIFLIRCWCFKAFC